MEISQYLVFYTACLAAVSANVDPDQECQVRFQDNDVCVCSTHDPEGQVKCHNDTQTIEIRPCTCLYYDKHLNQTVMGACFYTCYEHDNILMKVNNSTDFNDNFCHYDGPTNRQGFFCYGCNETLALAVHSYLLIDCVPCEDYGYKNWFKYFAIALLPQTLFYILFVLLSCNITSSNFGGIILVMQCIAAFSLRTNTSSSAGYNKFIGLILGLFSIANLNFNFSEFLYDPFCLHPDLNILEKLALEYISPLYSFFLIFVTYILITAYDKQYKLLVWMWKPFKNCFHRYRNTWNIHTSLIEIFSAFILLSFIKVLSVSIEILSLLTTYDVAGNKLNNYVVSYSDNIKYFSSIHLPFAMLAVSMTSLFIVLPLLLIIYPSRYFHRCLNCCGLRLKALHVFMDAFQGSYKTSPRDMRYFSAFYLLLRLAMPSLDLFLSQQTLYVAGILSLASSAVIALFKPYRVNSHNTIGAILILLMGIYFISCNEASLLASLDHDNMWNFGSIFQGLALSLVLLFFISLIVWKLLRKKIRSSIKMIKMKWNSSLSSHEEDSTGELIEPFDRDLDSSLQVNSYSPLI